MVEHLLWVLASDSDQVPTRICGLLAHRNIATTSIQMTRSTGSPHWLIQLVVSVGSAAEIEFVAKRLNRLIDVVKVIDVSAARSHQRRSVFVKLRPAADELVHVSEIVRLFAAEVIEVTPAVITLYISASPARCDEFLAMLMPYTVVEATPSAVFGIRSGPNGAYAGAHAIGGMAAFIPNRRGPEVNEVAMAKVRDDKEREAGDGFRRFMGSAP